MEYYFEEDGRGGTLLSIKKGALSRTPFLRQLYFYFGQRSRYPFSDNVWFFRLRRLLLRAFRSPLLRRLSLAHVYET